MSQASLADSMADMFLNVMGLNSLKMALRAFQFLNDSLSSFADHSISLLSKVFPNSSFLVGGDQPVKINFQACSSMDLMNAHI